MCQDANAARDEDNYNGDSDEDIYRMLLDDDDSDLFSMVCISMLFTLINTAIGLSGGNHC